MAKSRMTHTERVKACIAGEMLDRPPVALWRHFPVDDQTPHGLAAATVAFQRRFDFDLVKVTPSSSFCLKDWGIEDEWRGDNEGTRVYTRAVVVKPGDWERLPVLDANKGYLAEQTACLRIIIEELGSEVPVIQTIFSPLAQAKNLIGRENLSVHLRQYPDAVHTALRTITESTRRFIEVIIQTGVAGIFYAVQHGSYALLSKEEYRLFGRYYDLQVLEAAQGLWLNLLHLHGNDVMFDEFLDYPVQILNWHDQETPPTLSEGQAKFQGVVCGGLGRQRTLVLGTPQQIETEAQQAFRSTAGKRFILGTGCVTPVIAPAGNLMAVRQIVERM
jgi:uroporphyrinogen decarboxylase